jgi:hypothetical protein
MSVGETICDFANAAARIFRMQAVRRSHPPFAAHGKNLIQSLLVIPC